MAPERPRTAVPSSGPISIERLEAALALVSYAILQDGAAYTPYFDRLEREIAKLRASEDTMSRAKRFLVARRVPNKNPAEAGLILSSKSV